MTVQRPRGPLPILGHGLVSAVLAWSSCVGLAHAAVPSWVATPLKVEPGPGIDSGWRVERASVTENFRQIEVEVTVESVAPAPIETATFYGELYDGSGRLCFTALFSLTTNTQRLKGPILPGQARTLYSSSVFLASATQPRLMRFYLTHQYPPPGSVLGREVAPRVWSPAALSPISLYPSGQWDRLCLGGTGVSSSAPLVDVALGLADVGPTGKLEHFQVLDALGTWPFAAWTEVFMSRVRFRPARLGGRPTAAKTLVLFRVVLREWNKGDAPYLPRSSAWVKSYTQSFPGGQVPVIDVIQLNRPPQTAPPGASNGSAPCFEDDFTPYWSQGISR